MIIETLLGYRDVFDEDISKEDFYGILSNYSLLHWFSLIDIFEMLYQKQKDKFTPSPTSIGYLALGVMLASAVINEIMARLKITYGKKENSVSLLSDGIHSRVDVYASLVVLIGLNTYLNKHSNDLLSILALTSSGTRSFILNTYCSGAKLLTQFLAKFSFGKCL